MRSSLLGKKAGNEKHPFKASDLRGLVNAIQKPIAIFEYSKGNMRNLIVDVERNGKKFLVGVTLNYKANDIEVNSVSGLFPKDNHEWVKWIQDGKAIRIDQKEKVQDIIDSLRTNPAESERIGLNLDSAAKVVETFENPTEPGKKLLDESENIQESGQNEGLGTEESAETEDGGKKTDTGATEEAQKPAPAQPDGKAGKWQDVGEDGLTREERMEGEQGAELGSDEVALRDALAERLRGAGIEVITDDVAGQEVLDAENEDVRLMGSRTGKRMQQIGAEMEGRELSPEEKAVADVFSGKADNAKLTVSRDGKPVSILMRQGSETKAGAKHSVFRHYGTNTNNYTADEILRIPEIVENGKRSKQGNRVSYEYTDESTHTTYTVTTETNNRGEEAFTNFYTNRKKQNRLSRGTRPKAHKPNNDNASSGAKVGNIFERNGKTGENFRFFRTESGEAYGFTADGRIYLDPRVATAEPPVHEYTHLWSDALREGNPAAWGNVVELMRGTWAWEHVQRLYPELTSDDAIADEALAHYSGRRGAERARAAMAEAEKQGGLLGRAAAISGLERLQKALGRFWQDVCGMLGVRFTTADEVADRVMADLMNGVKPKGRSTAEVRAERGETAQDVARGNLAAEQVKIVEGTEQHGFKTFAEAREWAKGNIVRTLTNEETGGKGSIRISNTAVAKFLSEKAVRKSDGKDIHLAVLKVLPDVIRESVDAEQHPDYKKDEVGSRSAENGINENVTIHRLYGAVNIGDKTYRVKTTLKEDHTQDNPKKAYSYEATEIELLPGQSENPVGFSRNDNNSISGAKLLQGVEKPYEPGKKLLDESENIQESRQNEGLDTEESAESGLLFRGEETETETGSAVPRQHRGHGRHSAGDI